MLIKTFMRNHFGRNLPTEFIDLELAAALLKRLICVINVFVNDLK